MIIAKPYCVWKPRVDYGGELFLKSQWDPIFLVNCLAKKLNRELFKLIDF